MFGKKLLHSSFAFALLPYLQHTAVSQEVAFGNWLAVEGQPELQYRWSVHPSGTGSLNTCLLQVRGTDQNSPSHYVGTVAFENSTGKTLVRSLEVDLRPGAVVTRSAGPSCHSVTAVNLKARTSGS